MASNDTYISDALHQSPWHLTLCFYCQHWIYFPEYNMYQTIPISYDQYLSVSYLQIT